VEPLLRSESRSDDPRSADDGVEHGRVAPFTWDALIAHFKDHNARWKQNSENTKIKSGYYLDQITKVLGRFRVDKSLDAVKLLIRRKEFGDEASGIKPAPAAALKYYVACSVLCEHARKRPLQWIDRNPVRDIDKPRLTNRDGHATWTPAEADQFRAACPDDLSAYETG
jgi:hypothetical protein